jgi:hypothetical protein
VAKINIARMIHASSNRSKRNTVKMKWLLHLTWMGKNAIHLPLEMCSKSEVSGVASGCATSQLVTLAQKNGSLNAKISLAMLKSVGDLHIITVVEGRRPP